jgi:hypothetical protein
MTPQEARLRASKLIADCATSDAPVQDIIAKALLEVQRETAGKCAEIIENVENPIDIRDAARLIRRGYHV